MHLLMARRTRSVINFIIKFDTVLFFNSVWICSFWCDKINTNYVTFNRACLLCCATYCNVILQVIFSISINHSRRKSKCSTFSLQGRSTEILSSKCICKYNRSMHTICSQSYWFSVERKRWTQRDPSEIACVLFSHTHIAHTCEWLLQWMTSPLIHFNHSSFLPGSGAPRPMRLQGAGGTRLREIWVFIADVHQLPPGQRPHLKGRQCMRRRNNASGPHAPAFAGRGTFTCLVQEIGLWSENVMDVRRLQNFRRPRLLWFIQMCKLTYISVSINASWKLCKLPDLCRGIKYSRLVKWKQSVCG